MAETYELPIDQGGTLQVPFFLKDENGTALNLTGYSARMQMRTSYNATVPSLSLSSTDGSITIDAALGKLTLNATAATTASLAARRYVYDIEIVSPSGFVTRIVQGNAVVSPEVTR